MHDDSFNEINRALGRIEGLLESMADIPERVKKLESWRSYLSGAFGILTAIVVGMFERTK